MADTLDTFQPVTTILDTDLLHVKKGTGANSDKRITGANVKALFATAAQGSKADSAVQDDGSTPLSANWDVGAFRVTALTFTSDQATGTAPFIVASTTVVANLNASLLQGNAASAFATAAQGSKADSATQPGDLGTAAAENVGFFADAAQGATADSAVQPGDIGTAAAENVGFFADAAQGSLADSAAQDADLKKYIGQNLQTGTSYTLVLTDAGKMVDLSNGSAITLTIPANASVAFPVNTRIDLSQHGAGLVTVVITSDTLRGDPVSVGQYKGLSLWKRTSTEWVIYGGTTA